MPGNHNERVPRDRAQIPNVRNWAVRDYGNRVGIWRVMEVLTRYGIRASAASSFATFLETFLINLPFPRRRLSRRDDPYVLVSALFAMGMHHQ